MSRRRLAVLTALALGACTLVTSAQSYNAVSRACSFCADPALKHAPCPSPSSAGTGGTQVQAFVLKSLDFGADPARWDAGDAVGLDLDCSRRPAGQPVLCDQQAGALPTASLPGGVDNSLALSLATSVGGRSLGAEVQRAVNAELDGGYWSMVLIIDHWNGTADDDEVGVRLLFSSGVQIKPAQWNEADVWGAVSPGNDDAGLPTTPFSSRFDGGRAYVTGGTLVWDARGIKGGTLRLQNNEDHGVGAVDLALADATLVGALQPDRLDATLAAVWPTGAANLWPDFLAGRDLRRNCDIRAANGPNWSSGWGGPIVADMPSPPGCGGERCAGPCGAISVGLRLGFVAVAHVEADPSHVPIPAISSDVQCDGG